MSIGLPGLADLTRLVRFVALRQEVPLAGALALTDRCQLACRHCRIANLTGRDMPLAEVEAALRRQRQLGIRALALEGGEPFLWRDGPAGLEDVVRLAGRLGFWRVHVYTNGLLPIHSSADKVWVSIDGLRATYAALRGDHFDRVVANVRAARVRRLGIVFTVNRRNRDDLRPVLELARRLPVDGVMVFLHTPYYGRDELAFSSDERAVVIDELISLRRAGLPLLNTPAALAILRSGDWPRPNRIWWVSDAAGDHPCCRAAAPDVCRECGYAGCVELIAAQRLRPSAVRALL
jgi:MoaA/NifB/PqqE/SkfB family radical SAM enzyme